MRVPKTRTQRKNSPHALPIVIILIISLALGGVFELTCLGVERLTHPREYESAVSNWALEYGVPEYIVYALIKTESGFDSTKQGTDGEIGLMQLTPARYVTLANAANDPGVNAAALYDPDTSIRYGTMYLAQLYQKYGMWSTVFAAWHAGEEKVDAWLQNPAYIDPDFGTLITVPDKSIAKAVKKTVKAQQIYEKLYY
ncbi:MAG: lytic transglycosylase domain-containing protein [Clostridia bacterium]|nr:lytic transglycosylase domain-containing protein [Clostridia bacterium]